MGKQEEEIVSHKEERKMMQAEAKRIKKKLKKSRRRKKTLLLLLALGGGAAFAARSYMKKPVPGSGQVVMMDENPGPLSSMLGEILKGYMQDPSKKAVADKMHVSMAIEDLDNSEMTTTINFAGSDITVRNGVDSNADIYIGTELPVLLALTRIPLGPQAIQWFMSSEEGQQIVTAVKNGKLKVRGLEKHPGQMMLYGKLMAPTA
ncbi:MAG: hypothetical protein A2W01_01190 [Candidatus Solincola sediminis]|uniref:SCP2 domain-containing protein n=1 Tax=Candidatus Solincola sediminis TaxID=1797199 RepID=A0A1F2WUG9_9ACTN|nr:MAG: hypothetical protein A2W01_01190 [Candidatus Solincola sediminis]OFW60501.1 MAG: hypothetical protein A2Y75_06290 [Candidatus Solincola sediminis]